MHLIHLTDEEKVTLTALYRRVLEPFDWEVLGDQALNSSARRAYLGPRSVYLPYDPDRPLYPWQREMNACWRAAFDQLAAEHGLQVVEEQVHAWEFHLRPSTAGRAPSGAPPLSGD